MKYIGEAAKGVTWMGTLRIVVRSLTVVKYLVLARLLTPEQFGFFGVAVLVLGFIEILTDTGVNVVLIQLKDKIDDYIDTAWIISILRGVVISAAIYLSAPYVAEFFNVPSATPLIALISFVPLIKGFINPSIIKFQKEMFFRTEFLFRSSIFLVDTFLAVIIGVLTRSEMALAMAMLAGAFVEVILSMFLVSPFPRPRWNKTKAIYIVRTGVWVTMAGTLEYLFQHIDDIVVGKLLGGYALGLYQQSYRVATLTTSETGEVFNKVTFPLYTKLRDSSESLKTTFFKVTVAISVLILPLGLFIVLFAPGIVGILLGENWMSTIPILRVLAVFGVVKAYSNSFHALFLARSMQKEVFIVSLVGIFTLSLPLLPLVDTYGTTGAALAATTGALASLLTAIFFYKTRI